MTTDELRKRYLDFFKSKSHKVFSSDSLIPADDPSLLFTGAGMNQFKPYFLGLKKDVRRAASCQKCLRTADLDRVGKTAYHHSFFEMLGNFSFGDYFKEEAITWAWEFVTKELGLPKQKLWVSVYEEDEEAFQIWKKKIGIAQTRIVRFGAVDNFWPSNAKIDGPNGPCGPCSEIYVGETPSKGVEIWNLVFTQFDRQSDGTLLALPQKNIDTGMGLERTSAVLQGVSSNFDIDLFQQIRGGLKHLLKTDLENTAHENAVMDHIRAVVFSIADGALPSNEGRGYVIRKLIRLGADHLMKAGAEGGSFYKLVPAVVSVMSPAYAELKSREKNILSIVENEEHGYLEVLRNQLPRLETDVLEIKSKCHGTEVLYTETAKLAFKYYDTYGVPFDNVLDCFERNSLPLEAARLNKRFDELLDQQKKRSRESSKMAGEIFSKNELLIVVQDLPSTEFLGYRTAESEAKLIRIIRGKEKTEVLSQGEEGLLIFDKTPFYAEAGGQVGDMGIISGESFKAKVLDTQWLEKSIVHKVFVEQGRVSSEQKCILKIDSDRRTAIMKNHTATHLLHSALRKVLGSHVKQNGSLVAPDRLRFDFTHFGALDAKTLGAVEDLVNEEIQKSTRLNKKVMTKDEALKEGAIAFFGEKYADEVRVITIGDFSKELCGGTHLESTDEIGLFKILSESSIQAGVRRIEAVTGKRAAELIAERENERRSIAAAFGVPMDALLPGLQKAQAQMNEAKNRLSALMGLKMKQKVSQVFQEAQEIKGVKIVVDEVKGVEVELLQKCVEQLRTMNTPFIALFCSSTPDKISFVVAASSKLVSKGFDCGKLVKQIAAVVGGNGGGRSDFAVGGGKEIAKKEEAFRFGKTEMKRFLEALGSNES